MCLAVPSRIVKINGFHALVDVMGAQREISLMLLPEKAKEGDYVLVHAGYAIQKIDEEAALDSMNLIKEIIQKLEEEGLAPED
jgi:hydrogenase expression/formation protein HypC